MALPEKDPSFQIKEINSRSSYQRIEAHSTLGFILTDLREPPILAKSPIKDGWAFCDMIQLSRI